MLLTTSTCRKNFENFNVKKSKTSILKRQVMVSIYRTDKLYFNSNPTFLYISISNLVWHKSIGRLLQFCIFYKMKWFNSRKVDFFNVVNNNILTDSKSRIKLDCLYNRLFLRWEKNQTRLHFFMCSIISVWYAMLGLALNTSLEDKVN